MTVEERIEQHASDANVKAVASFGKSMPPAFDPDGMLKEGDTFTVESLDKIYSRVFGTTTAEFIPVKVIHADGTESSFDFYPSMLSKTIFPAEMVNGEAKLKLPVLHPKGTIVDKYLSFRGKGTEEKTDVQLAMESLVGVTIKVTGDTIVKTQKWVNGKAINELKDTHVFTYDEA